MEKIKELIIQAKKILCYPEKNGLSLRKELKDITQNDLDIQWGVLNELQIKASPLDCVVSLQGAGKLKTKYKFVYFEEMEWLNTGKTKHYDCKNIKSNYSLGMVEWERGWRQYVFSPNGSDVIFSTGCLLDIIDFIKQLKATQSS